MDPQDETFEAHFTSKKCQTDFKKLNPSKEEIQYMVKDLHPLCTNRKTESGWDVGIFAPDDLIKYEEDGKTYCFAPGDNLYVYDKEKERTNKINPHTGKSMEISNEMYGKLVSRAPMLHEYIYKGCPILKSVNPLVRFVRKSVRGDYVKQGNLADRSPAILYRGILEDDWKPPSWADGKDIGIYDENQFVELKPIYDPLSNLKGVSQDKKIPYTGKYSLGIRDIEDYSRAMDNSFAKLPRHTNLSMYEAVKLYMSSPLFSIDSLKLVEDLKKLKIRLSKPIKVYRGLKLQTEEPIWKKLNVGEIVKLEDIHEASSWTTEICVAAGFASSGVVLSYTAQPEEVVLDTRLLSLNVLKELYEYIQYEVILDKRERNVTVELIIRGGGQPVPRYIHSE